MFSAVAITEPTCVLDDDEWQKQFLEIVTQEIEEWVMPVNNVEAYKNSYKISFSGKFEGYIACGPGLKSWNDFLLEHDGEVPVHKDFCLK